MGSAPHGASRPSTRVVERPLSGTQLIGCASIVVAKLYGRGSAMIRMTESEDLRSMAREAVVLADRSYRPCAASRKSWAINKGVFLVLDMLRMETRHEVCLTITEFRGTTRDHEGKFIRPRRKLSLSEPLGEDEEDSSTPGSYLKAETPPPWLTVHNRHIRERLERALDAQPDQRAAIAFRLMNQHEWTQVEVAELFEITPSRVSQILKRLRETLRAEFLDLREDQRAA